MKVKFYKGPFHGQTRDVDLPATGGVLMAVMDKKAVQQAYTLQPGSDITLIQPLGVRHVLYRIKIMSGNIGGRPYQSPAVHPDGSVFLEYVPDRKVK